MMKSMDLTMGDALYLYTICCILPDSSDFLPYKESLFLWYCIEPPGHAGRRPAIQQFRQLSHHDRSIDRELLSRKERELKLLINKLLPVGLTPQKDIWF